MRYLQVSLYTLLAAISLTGCQDKALLEMEAVKDKLCACKSQSCVRALDKEFKASETKAKHLSKADQEKAIEISLATLRCATAIGN